MPRQLKFNWPEVSNRIKENETKRGNKNKLDERIYSPKVKDDGSFHAIIRFLPSPDTDIPFVKLYSHGFVSSNGGWYIENCPTTIGKDCPVCVANTSDWNGGNKDIARHRARRLSCYANILVVKDPQNPENDGKIFIFRYGKKLHEKIMEKIDPPKDSLDDAKPVMIFSFDEGANFKLKIKLTKTDGKTYYNYDSSEFTELTALSEKQIEEIEKSLYPLKEFTDTNSFKSFDELEERFNKVIGGKVTSKLTSKIKDEVEEAGLPFPKSSDVDDDINKDIPPVDGENTESDDDFLKKLR